MRYTIKSTDGDATYKCFGRAFTIRLLRELGINEYAAIRMLDAADGLRPADGVERPYTVERS